MKSTHVLDCTRMKLPPWWPNDGPKILPLVKGPHEYDWYLVRAEIPESFYATLIENIIHRDTGINYTKSAMKKPIGFRERTLPIGAVIREIQ